MRRRSAIANRVRLAVVGVVALAGAAWFVLARLGMWGAWGLAQPDLSTPMFVVPAAWRGDRASWVLVAVGAVAVLLGLWWLIRQFPPRWRVRWFGLESDERGRTGLSTDALADAVADDVAALTGVASSSARMFGARAQPELLMQVDVEDGADVGELLGAIEDDVLPDLEGFLDARLSHVGVRIRTGARIAGQMEYAPIGEVVAEPVEVPQLEAGGPPADPMPRPTAGLRAGEDAGPRTRDGRLLR